MAAPCKPATSAPALPVTGVADITTSNYYGSAAATPGSATGGSWIAALFTVINQSVNATKTLVSGLEIPSNQGMRLRVFGANATLNCDAYNGSGALISGATSFTIAAGQVGKISMAIASADRSTNKLRLFVNRNEIGVGASLVGFNANSAYGIVSGVDYVDGQASGSSLRIHGVYWGSSSSANLSLANAQSYFDAVKAANSLVNISGVADIVQEDWWMLTGAGSVANGGSIGAAGAQNLSFGSLTVATTTGYNW